MAKLIRKVPNQPTNPKEPLSTNYCIACGQYFPKKLCDDLSSRGLGARMKCPHCSEGTIQVILSKKGKIVLRSSLKIIT